MCLLFLMLLSVRLNVLVVDVVVCLVLWLVIVLVCVVYRFVFVSCVGSCKLMLCIVAAVRCVVLLLIRAVC